MGTVTKTIAAVVGVAVIVAMFIGVRATAGRPALHPAAVAFHPGCLPSQHSTWHVFCSPTRWIWDPKSW